MKNKKPEIKRQDLFLDGERIYLRPLKQKDAIDIYQNIRFKKVIKNLLVVPYPYHLKDAKEFVRSRQRLDKKLSYFVFGIILKKTNRLIGCIGLHHVNYLHKNAELGYWLGPKFWHQGYMTEAGKLILGFAFKKLKLQRVFADVFSTNLASQRVLKKLGFKKDGVRRKHWQRLGQWKTGFCFGILKEEYNK
jgi:RimJ/RimL family protein N-acetyltransferase